MLPDRVSNPGPLTYESGALPVYITILSVFVSIVHGVCLYSISGPFLFYALKPFILCTLFIYFVTSDFIG